MKRRLLALTLMLALLCGLLPLTASASSQDGRTAVRLGATIDELMKKYGVSTGGDNVLRKDLSSKTGGKVLGSQLKRDKIQSITFLNTTKNAPSDCWDVSQDQDCSVLAWTEKCGSLYDLYIAGDGGVSAPENSSGLFCGYTELTEINFDGYFDTENATSMSYMFAYCKKLESLDLSDFDTSSVKRMECMFMHCYKLTSLDLSDFVICNVTDMGSMFWGNKEMRWLTMPSLKDGVKRNTAYMFEKCNSKLSVCYN